MICLALDFAGPIGQVGIAEPDRIIHRAARAAGPGTLAGIVPFLLEAINTAGLAPADIGRFMAIAGPGSFTGIRVGLAAASGLAEATGRPLDGITLFEALGRTVPPRNMPMLIALDGRRRELFIQVRGQEGIALQAPASLAPEALHDWAPTGPLHLAGSAAKRAKTALVEAGRPTDDLTVLPDSDLVDIALLAQQAAADRLAGALGPPIAYYCREPDVSHPA